MVLETYFSGSIYGAVSNSHRDGPSEPGILVNVVTFESYATSWRVHAKVATLIWMGHGFGLRRAQLLTLNPKPFHIYTPNPWYFGALNPTALQPVPSRFSGYDHDPDMCVIYGPAQFEQGFGIVLELMRN